jgi:hypothetical protein
MQKYQLNEGTLELPDMWVDQTMNIFPSSASTPADFSVVITRDNPFANESLEEYFERQIKQLPDALPGFKEIRRGKLKVDGKDAVDIEYQWIGQGKKMHIRQVGTIVNDAVMNITATAMAPHFPKHAPEFDKILNSIKFDK